MYFKYVFLLLVFQLLYNSLYTGCGKKSNPLSYCTFLSNRLQFSGETLQLYSLFILT